MTRVDHDVSIKGAGKGTLSARLVKKYNIDFVSAGDLLRQNIADKWVSRDPREVPFSPTDTERRLAEWLRVSWRQGVSLI